MTTNEDKWAHQAVGAPFPEDPVRVQGQQNQYVAMGYIHGKPVHGRAWNNNGKVECSFPYMNRELTGPNAMGGNIQILQSKGNHLDNGFWYNWIKYSERAAKPPAERNLVKCGYSMPILWTNRPEGAILGALDTQTEVATFPHDKIVTQKHGGELVDMLVIAREFTGGPPGCECPKCLQNVTRLEHKVWTDIRAGDAFPPKKLVRALDRSINTLVGENPDQYVALWYIQGEPVFGRVWNANGVLACCFSWGGHEYRSNVGSCQVLVMPSYPTYDYIWMTYSEAIKIRNEAGRERVRINTGKIDASPAVISIDGKQILGTVDVMSGVASYGIGGTEKTLKGSAVQNCQVLCRKARPGMKII